MALLKKFCLLMILFGGISVYSQEYIPVLMWETSKNHIPVPKNYSALGGINEESFKNILLEKFNKDKVFLVFLEENLSTEDFTACHSSGENIFSFLSNLSSKAQVSYYPFVEAPLKALKSLPNLEISKLDGSKFEPGKVLIFDLNDCIYLNDCNNRNVMLSRHDDLIKFFYLTWPEIADNVVAIYTGRHSSWNEISRKARHLMQVPESKEELSNKALRPDKPRRKKQEESNSTYVTLKTPTTLLVVRPPLFYTVKESVTEINNIKLEDTDENITSISDDKFQISFTFQDKFGYYILTNLDVKQGGETVCPIKPRDFYAPFGFSYHCSKAVYSTDKCNLTIPGLQIQRFKNGTAEKFDEAYHCDLFMTVPILMGLFVTFILLAIFFIGITFIMDIKRVVRFDDPQKPHLEIIVAD